MSLPKPWPRSCPSFCPVSKCGGSFVRIILFSNTSLLQKLLLRLRENHLFQDRSLEKSVQNGLQNSIEQKKKNVKISCKFHSILASPEIPGRLWAISLALKIQFFPMKGSTSSPRGLLVPSENDFGPISSGFGRFWGSFWEDFEKNWEAVNSS